MDGKKEEGKGIPGDLLGLRQHRYFRKTGRRALSALGTFGRSRPLRVGGSLHVKSPHSDRECAESAETGTEQPEDTPPL